MKKLMMIAGVASLFASGAALADTNQQALGGEVTTMGKVVADSCYVADNHVNRTVQLNEINSNALKNSVGGEQGFEIHLENCPYAGDVVGGKRKSKVKIHFAPAADLLLPGNTKVLKNVAQPELEAAKNVGVQILGNNDEAIDFAAPAATQQITAKALADADDGRLQFALKARYFGVNDKIEPGNVKATAAFNIVYE